jgi:alkanesulfonate monooxygenase SsuD/methylene tetrahydromethanopterin reductase-like flavin-dependent oxidoreductase (luciferase family)
MRFGTFTVQSVGAASNPADAVNQYLEQALAAERAGFYEVWLAEHNGRRYGMAGNVVVPAAAIAAATDTIRIGTAVTRLPLHHPVHLCQDLSYVDIVSKGRLDWGIGRGYDAYEFGAYGIPFDEAAARWEDTYEAVNHFWKTGRTQYKSQFHDLADSELLPTPLQGRTLPTYVTVAGSEGSVKWCAERLLPIMFGSGLAPAAARDRLKLYADTAADCGHSTEAIDDVLDRTWQLKQVHVGSTTERAIDEFRDGVVWYMNELNNRTAFGFSGDQKPYEYYVEHQGVLIGSSQRMIEMISEHHEKSSINNLICWMSIGNQPHQQVLNSIAQFGAEVIPALANTRRQASAVL